MRAKRRTSPYGSRHLNQGTPKRPSSFYAFAKARAHEQLKRIKRCQFLCILAVCLGILGFQTAKCFNKYFLKSTGTADKYVHASVTAFPEMTVCPTTPYRLESLVHHGVDTRSQIQFGSKWISDKIGVTPQQFYEEVTFSVEEIVVETLIHTELLINDTNSFYLAPNETLCDKKLFHTKQYYYNGDCFSFTLPDCLKTSGVLEVVMDFKNKTDVFIHHNGQFLSPNSRSRVDVDVGHFVKIAVNHEVVQLLSEEGSCVDTFVAREGQGEDSYDGCIYERLKEINEREVGCTVPWLPDKSNVCTEEEKRTEAFDLYQRNRRNQNDICPTSCLFTNMYFGPPVAGVQNPELAHVARAVFYFRRDVKTTTEYRLYSLLSMVAEIGGYVGLLMGVSLFKIAYVNNLFIDYLMARDESSRSSRDGVIFVEKPTYHM